MAIADNVAEIIRLDRLVDEMTAKRVVTIEDLKHLRWIKQQRSYQVRAIQNYQPPTSSIR